MIHEDDDEDDDDDDHQYDDGDVITMFPVYSRNGAISVRKSKQQDVIVAVSLPQNQAPAVLAKYLVPAECRCSSFASKVLTVAGLSLRIPDGHYSFASRVLTASGLLENETGCLAHCRAILRACL